MAHEVVSGGLGELRAASTAGGGTALTTTAAFIQLPLLSSHLFLVPRNFATGVVAQVAVNPYLVVLKTADAMVTAPTDYSAAAQDADAATNVVLSALDTLANGDFLLVGSHLPFRGAWADVDGANAVGSTLAVFYWNGTAWADASATDGSASGGATFAVDGLVSWTVPSAWVPAKLSAIYTSTPASAFTNLNYYWTRWSVSAALTNPTTLDALLAANRSTAYLELLSGQAWEQRIRVAQGGIGCIEAKINAGTGNLIVNVAASRDGRVN